MPDPSPAETLKMLDELERLERKATAGPWFPEHDRNYSADEMIDYAHAGDDTRSLFDTSNADEREIHTEDDDGGVYYTDPVGRANIVLAVAARNALPALLALARRAIDHVGACQSCGGCCCDNPADDEGKCLKCGGY